MEPSTTNQTHDSSTGMQTNVASLLTYVLGFITGLVFLLIEKKDETVRWHAAQSFAFSIALFVLYIVIGVIAGILLAVPFIGWIGWLLGVLVTPIISLGVLILWILLMVKAYQGEKWELPVISQLIPSVLKIGK